MDHLVDIPLYRDSVAGLKTNIGNMLKSAFPDHKLYFANGNIPTPSEKYIVVKRVVRRGNPNGLNTVPTHTYLDGLTDQKHYIYQPTISFRIKFHKDDAMEDAYYLKMLLSTEEFHWQWWGKNNIYGITNISDVADDPVSVDYVEWEEGAVFTFDCNYAFRHTESELSTVEGVIFTSNNGSGDRAGTSNPFWRELGYDNFKDYVTDVNTLYFHVNGDETTDSGVDFTQDW